MSSLPATDLQACEHAVLTTELLRLKEVPAGVRAAQLGHGNDLLDQYVIAC